MTKKEIWTKFGYHPRKKKKILHNNILGVSELSLSCQSTVMLTIDSCANVSAPRMAVRVYKTHFSLCENDRMQWVKTTKLSQTAVGTDNYQIYLLTMIRQNRFIKSIVWRQGQPHLLDRTDNYDNTPHTYTDRMLSITVALSGCRVMGEKFFEALVHYLSPSSKSNSSQTSRCEVPGTELGHRKIIVC